LFEFLETAGLRFGRWLKQAPYSPHCGVMAQLTHASRLRELATAEQSAAAELFRGTMIRHSVVAYRSDRAAAGARVSFSDAACLSYVPIRAPETICVRDRPQPEAAAVLINQSHTFRDLFLPIDATELRLFEAMDGTRCLGEIVDGGLPDDRARFETGRRFVERLWHHDQIVIDAASTRYGRNAHVTRHHAVNQPALRAPGLSHALEADGRGM
jgi:hypothetical protein